MILFFRVIKFAFQDIYRNLSLSLMTVLILVLMLMSVNTLVVIRVLTTEATNSIKKQIDVSIFFSKEATEKQVQEVKSYLSSFPEVTDVAYHTREDVLKQFREQYAGNKQIVTSLDELGENPLGATIILKTREPEDYQKIITALSIPEYENIIQAKSFGDTEKAIERINTITTHVEKFSILLTIVFAIIAFLIIFNTIRVAIYTQRIEISIKKLVGASNWFIRSPYIIEAFMFSLFSTVIAYGMVYISARFLDPYITIVFGHDGILTNYFVANILLLLAGQFLVVLLLTIFSSWLAMRRHLKV